MSELALIFDKLEIDTSDVLEAAATKWNFLNFKPGLVGGHCIGVDPYYPAHKAELLGYHPEVILSGRRVNDYMSTFIARKVVKLMLAKNIAVKNSRALILGITFKENCPDIRNTKCIDIYHELKQYGINVDVFDPWAKPQEVEEAFQFSLIDDVFQHTY
ncbi:UDP binding domain-containing protein [Paradesertivirga mongoliensis]|uniref:UDP binding domain-containing protein n=1 Tax=Paradesertivirga mongoliensis TaxID=2100740 RepID=A0ABW4ZIS1_9SPHI